jgi:hypothetical protein
LQAPENSPSEKHFQNDIFLWRITALEHMHCILFVVAISVTRSFVKKESDVV